MNLKDLISRLFDEQGWREQKARQYSSGLGSLPYNFDEMVQKNYPGVINRNNIYDQKEDEMTRIYDSLSRGLGQPPTTNFLDYYQQRKMIDNRKQKLNDLFQNYLNQSGGTL